MTQAPNFALPAELNTSSLLQWLHTQAQARHSQGQPALHIGLIGLGLQQEQTAINAFLQQLLPTPEVDTLLQLNPLLPRLTTLSYGHDISGKAQMLDTDEWKQLQDWCATSEPEAPHHLAAQKILELAEQAPTAMLRRPMLSCQVEVRSDHISELPRDYAHSMALGGQFGHLIAQVELQLPLPTLQGLKISAHIGTGTLTLPLLERLKEQWQQCDLLLAFAPADGGQDPMQITGLIQQLPSQGPQQLIILACSPENSPSNDQHLHECLQRPKAQSDSHTHSVIPANTLGPLRFEYPS